jgi:hypothetical protein
MEETIKSESGFLNGLHFFTRHTEIIILIKKNPNGYNEDSFSFYKP